MSSKPFNTKFSPAVVRASIGAIEAKSHAARLVLHPDAPSCTTLHRAQQSDKTKPFERELSPRQLAVARALVRGGPIIVIARETQTSRHTINRWRRLPKFQAELKRLHELLARQPISQPVAPPPRLPSRPPPRSTHAIDRKFDKMIDDFLGRATPHINRNSSS
ncbi:hypothetical protein BH09PLA1_BH09PLA1_36960 [soil metagenome]